MLFSLIIINRDSNPMFKIAWLIPMLTVPVFGWLLYAMFQRRKVSVRTQKKYEAAVASAKGKLVQDEKISESLRTESYTAYRQSEYIEATTNACIFASTHTHFYPTGEDFFPDYIESLEKAERFIFLEYFIIEEGIMWNKVLDILKRKAKKGVDIRVMYDDMGTISLLKPKYNEYLESFGIKAAVFNPFKSSIDIFMNYRDHRKITVIDGNIAYTGGLNLSDEYINEKKRFGYWKDCAIKLEGSAVSAMTRMFLELWQFASGIQEPKLSDFLYAKPCKDSDGYVQPFDDGPMNGHLTSELSYINILNGAEKYVYITTPYLILDNEMITALKLAATSGIDVRIITPHIPDKWYVHAVTRSNYKCLLKFGVKIYEYTPGFVHAKTIISDDNRGIVGTANFDFRSFYMHFENSIYMYNSAAISEVKEDYIDMLAQCTRISLDDYMSEPIYKRIAGACLKIFSPLM